jgi:hypothetical protein
MADLRKVLVWALLSTLPHPTATQPVGDSVSQVNSYVTGKLYLPAIDMNPDRRSLLVCSRLNQDGTLEEAQRVLDQWRAEYNNDPPHGSLNQLPPPNTRLAGERRRTCANWKA